MTHITETDFIELVSAAKATHDRIQVLEEAMRHIWRVSTLGDFTAHGLSHDEAIGALRKITFIASKMVDPKGDA